MEDIANYEYTLPQRLKRTENDIARFWGKVEKRGTDECWPWKGGRITARPREPVYGTFGVTLTDGRSYSYRAHRFAWMLLNGEIPRGLVIMHTCDVPLCVNPAHLELATQVENTHDRDRKKRHRYGEKHNMVVLNEQQVREIYLTPRSVSHRQLAARYPVTEHAIGAIRRDHHWQHVTADLENPWYSHNTGRED